MKAVVTILCLVILAMSVESAGHHRRHKEHNVSTEHEHDHLPTSSPPPPGNGNDDEGGVAWPEPVEINNYEVPDAYRGDSDGDAEPSPAGHHGRSRHRSRAH